jgi:hypothetical protein
MTFAQNAGLTLFSSSDYCQLQHNKCGVIAMRGKENVELFSLGDNWHTAKPKMTMSVSQGIGLKRVFENRPPISRPARPTAPKSRERRLRTSTDAACAAHCSASSQGGPCRSASGPPPISSSRTSRSVERPSLPRETGVRRKQQSTARSPRSSSPQF